jgi:hypothetical protein
MATNRRTVRGLDRVVELIDELNAWKKIISGHSAQQKRQVRKNRWYWEYDPRKKKLSWRKAKRIVIKVR